MVRGLRGLLMRDSATTTKPRALLLCEDVRRRQPSVSLGARCVSCALAKAFAGTRLATQHSSAQEILSLDVLELAGIHTNRPPSARTGGESESSRYHSTYHRLGRIFRTPSTRAQDSLGGGGTSTWICSLISLYQASNCSHVTSVTKWVKDFCRDIKRSEHAKFALSFRRSGDIVKTEWLQLLPG